MKYTMSTRRKLAIATWGSPREGNIYGKITVDMTNAIKYIQYLRDTSGEKVTITHLVGKAAGNILAKTPDLNGRIFMGSYIPHETADLAFLIAIDEGKDLGKFKVCEVDKKTVVEVSRELRVGSEKLRAKKDSEFEKSKPLLTYFPTWFIKPAVWLMGYITGAWGRDLKALGVSKYPFGACIITSVGMLGLDEGYAPPTPFARVPVYITVGQVKNSPTVIDDLIAIRPMISLMATVDHRFLDGYQGAQLAKLLRYYIEEAPWKLDGYETPPFHE